jgi:hypothetical protein
MDTIYDITDLKLCDIAQIIGESNRFLFHVMLVHTVTVLIEQKKAFFSEEFFRTLVITSTAIVLYHLFFRKIIEPKIEKMKLICYADEDKEKDKHKDKDKNKDKHKDKHKDKDKNKLKSNEHKENTKKQKLTKTK